jgi:hypothetical protein
VCHGQRRLTLCSPGKFTVPILKSKMCYGSGMISGSGSRDRSKFFSDPGTRIPDPTYIFWELDAVPVWYRSFSKIKLFSVLLNLWL